MIDTWSIQEGSGVRKSVDPASIAELAASIKSVGLLHAIVVRPKGQQYEVVCGVRRLQAVRKLGQGKIRCTVINTKDLGRTIASLSENIQREDLDPFDEAQAYQHLMETQSMSIAELARLLNKHHDWVARRLALFNLCPEAVEAVNSGELSASRASYLGRLSQGQQPSAIEIAKTIPYRELKQILAKMRADSGDRRASIKRGAFSFAKRELIRLANLAEDATEKGMRDIHYAIRILGGTPPDDFGGVSTHLTQVVNHMREHRGTPWFPAKELGDHLQISALAALLSKESVRDGGLVVKHPRKRGYYGLSSLVVQTDSRPKHGCTLHELCRDGGDLPSEVLAALRTVSVPSAFFDDLCARAGLSEAMVQVVAKRIQGKTLEQIGLERDCSKQGAHTILRQAIHKLARLPLEAFDINNAMEERSA